MHIKKLTSKILVLSFVTILLGSTSLLSQTHDHDPDPTNNPVDRDGVPDIRTCEK